MMMDEQNPEELSANDKNLSLLSHIGPVAVSLLTGGILGFVIPLTVLFYKNDQPEWVKSHARESLNFHLTFLLAAVILIAGSIATLGLGLLFAIPALLIMWVVEMILGIVAAAASSRGEAYRYPLSIRFFS